MSENQYSVDNSWNDESHIIIPPRSYLYCMEPIGISTAFVESLTSYLSRLAQMHLVYPGHLLVEELFPLFQRAYLPNRHYNNNLTAFWKDSATLNSINLSTQDWVQALEKLTLRNDLRYLTMLAWSEVLSPKYLLRRSKAWCSSCYREWHESGTKRYEPLLWMLEVVTVCSRHNCYLDTQCVNQKCKRHLSMLASHTRPGYCDYCGCWLGELTEPLSVGRVPSEDELKWQKWVIEGVGELLAAAPTLPKRPQSEIFARAVIGQLNTVFDGNVSALARRLQVSRRTIRDWANNAQAPQLDSLLQFCYLFGISPLRLIESDSTDDGYAKNDITVSLELKRKTKKHYRTFNAEQTRSALEEELSEKKDPPPPMSAVAKQLHYDQTFLHNHFPDLCCAISDRFRAYRKKQRVERNQRILEEVQQTTRQVYEQGVYPSQERVRLLLAKPGSMREAGALAAWHATLRELGIENTGL